MINVKQVKRYCSEDIINIENYDKAINDDTQTWISHHRRETDEGLSKKQLIELGLYYKRPANELIFLTPSKHTSLHQIGKPSWNKGKHLSEEHKQNLSTSLKDAVKGEKNPMYGKHQTEETKKKKSESMKGKNKDKYRVWNDENDHSKGYHYEK